MAKIVGEAATVPILGTGFAGSDSMAAGETHVAFGDIRGSRTPKCPAATARVKECRFGIKVDFLQLEDTTAH